MTEQEKMIEKLRSGANTHDIAAKISGDPGAAAYHVSMARTMRDAAEMIEQMFTPSQVCAAMVVHGQGNRRFKLGETISYSPSEVEKILRGEI